MADGRELSQAKIEVVFSGLSSDCGGEPELEFIRQAQPLFLGRLLLAKQILGLELHFFQPPLKLFVHFRLSSCPIVSDLKVELIFLLAF